MDDALGIVTSIISNVWTMLSGLRVPGINVTFATWFLAGLIITFSIAFFRYVLGLGTSGSGYRSGQSSKKHISENRKGDTH